MDPLDRLLAIVDSDLRAMFAGLGEEIDRELAKPKPNISALERRIAARLAVLYGTSPEETAASPMGRYAQGVLAAARGLSGTVTVPSITEDRDGSTTARRLWNSATSLRAMLVANLRHFATAKPGRFSKGEVRRWFREFLTPEGAADSLGMGGDHGLHEVRRTIGTEARREFGVGVRVAALMASGAVRWTVAADHTHRDNCDANARANRFGLGAGVYPPGDVPRFPDHPFCKCRLEVA